MGDGGRVLHDVHDRSLRQTLVDASQLARADAGARQLKREELYLNDLLVDC